MKKFFILGLLIAPIAAHATDPVGPSAVPSGGTAVVATASAPYATATAETGDTTNVVSASYVKGAYNDAIAAVNKVNNDKQDKLTNVETGQEMINVLGDASFADLVESGINHSANGAWQHLVSAQAIANEMVSLKNNVTLVTYDDDDEDVPIQNYVLRSINAIDDSEVNQLITATGVRDAIDSVNNTISAKRISAVTTWGNDTPTKLQLTNQ